MNFYVTILGSGAATPTLGRHCSAQMINMNGHRMLLDCGESTQSQMRAFHQKMQSVGTIFLSHLHGDHIFGLPGLLASMHLCGKTDGVTVYSPPGLGEVLTRLFEVSGTNLDYPLSFVEVDPTTLTEPVEIFRDSACIVKAFPLFHSVPCLGFIFEENIQYQNLRHGMVQQYGLTPIDIQRIKQGEDYTTPDGTVIPNAELALPKRKPLRYAYCCDTKFDPSLVEMVAGVDLLCMECTFDNGRASLAEEKGHCTALQAAQLAKQAGVKQLMLTHFSARYKDVTPLEEEAFSVFDNVITAADGMVVEL